MRSAGRRAGAGATPRSALASSRRSRLPQACHGRRAVRAHTFDQRVGGRLAIAAAHQYVAAYRTSRVRELCCGGGIAHVDIARARDVGTTGCQHQERSAGVGRLLHTVARHEAVQVQHERSAEPRGWQARARFRPRCGARHRRRARLGRPRSGVRKPGTLGCDAPNARIGAQAQIRLDCRARSRAELPGQEVSSR